MGVIILPFPDRTETGSRLLPRDKMELHAWLGSRPASAVDRVVLHDGAGPEDPEFVLFYEAGACWARWGLARQRGGLVLWECAYGQELGIFRTADAALVILDHHAALAARGAPATRPRRREAPMGDAAPIADGHRNAP